MNYVYLDFSFILIKIKRYSSSCRIRVVTKPCKNMDIKKTQLSLENNIGGKE